MTNTLTDCADPVAAARAAYDADYRPSFYGVQSSGWHDLDAWKGAEALGIDWRELSMLVGYGDIRILAHPALSTLGAVFRLRRWFALGKPDADPERIAYQGADSVRAIIVDVLRRLPVPVRHYAVEAVTWREVGRESWLYICSTPDRRALPCDGGHEIAINGLQRDDELPALICHELGHGVHRIVHTGKVDWSGRSDGGSLADLIRQGLVTRERWINARAADEVLADSMAALWGVPRSEMRSEAWHREMFSRCFDEAAEEAQRQGTPVPAPPHDVIAEIVEKIDALEARTDESIPAAGVPPSETSEPVDAGEIFPAPDEFGTVSDREVPADPISPHDEPLAMLTIDPTAREVQLPAALALIDPGVGAPGD